MGLREVACSLSIWMAHLGFATHCVTIANGVFTASTTWSCGCDPLTCDTLVIHHDISTVGGLVISPASFRISVTGFLDVEGELVVGIPVSQIIVDGTLEAQRVQFWASDSTCVNGTVHAASMITLLGPLKNAGTLTLVDSMMVSYSSSLFLNYGNVDCRIFLSNAPIENFGNISMVDGEIYEINNGGTIEAWGSLLSNAVMENYPGYTITVLDTLVLLRIIHNYGDVACGVFEHGGGQFPAVSYLYKGSCLTVTNGFNNAPNGTLFGPGVISIGGASVNAGTLGGNLDICDLTPGMTVPPFLDLNTGVFDSSVLFCNSSLCHWVGIRESGEPSVSVYPIPASHSVAIDPSGVSGVARIDLIDATGRKVQSHPAPVAGRSILERDGLPSGLYLAVLRSSEGRALATARVVFSDQ